MAVTSKTITQSISFPFQLGQTNFPKMSESNDVIRDSIESLLLTAKNERVMRT